MALAQLLLFWLVFYFGNAAAKGVVAVLAYLLYPAGLLVFELFGDAFLYRVNNLGYCEHPIIDCLLIRFYS